MSCFILYKDSHVYRKKPICLSAGDNLRFPISLLKKSAKFPTNKSTCQGILTFSFAQLGMEQKQ
eukprot:2015050-Amphidinium_carterae.1